MFGQVVGAKQKPDRKKTEDKAKKQKKEKEKEEKIGGPDLSRLTETVKRSDADRATLRTEQGRYERSFWHYY